MGGIVVDWTVGIESGVEGETGAYARALNLTAVGDVCRHIVPGKESLTDVWLWLYPTLVDGMGKAVGIDGSAGGLEVGVVAVEQLVPCAVGRLQRHKSVEVLPETFEDVGILAHVEHLARS